VIGCALSLVVALGCCGVDERHVGAGIGEETSTDEEVKVGALGYSSRHAIDATKYGAGNQIGASSSTHRCSWGHPTDALQSRPGRTCRRVAMPTLLFWSRSIWGCKGRGVWVKLLRFATMLYTHHQGAGCLLLGVDSWT